MKFRIEEIDDTQKDKHFSSDVTPLTYRISLRINNDEIVLRREYFYVGYRVGEKVEDFYFNNTSWNNNIIYASFLTRNFDSNHLQQKEKEFIEKFHHQLIESEKNIEEDFKKTEKIYQQDIKNYQNYQKCNIFNNIKRKVKLSKILK